MDADPRLADVDSHLRRPWRERAESGTGRRCAWPGCAAGGSHRAPRSRERLREFVWFCLEHVREYNRGWDFFVGMSAGEIDAHRRADVTWHRPTWRFGGPSGPGNPWPGHGDAGYGPRFDDPFGHFAGEGEPCDGAAGFRPPPPAGSTGRAAEMMRAMGLDTGFTHDDLRRRFKALVKRWHPDLHAGDKAAEARLREVIEAYRFLKDNRIYAG